MQCFEAEVTRCFLLARCREMTPNLKRDDLLLEEVLSRHGIHSTLSRYPNEATEDGAVRDWVGRSGTG